MTHDANIPPPRPVHPARARRGSVLVLTLTVVIVLTSLVLVMARSMRTEAVASANYLAQLQADDTARGAMEYLRAKLAGTAGTLPDDASLNTQAQRAGEGYFWLLKRDPTNDSTYAYGITDEAGKISLNTADADTLSRLPNLTPDLAAGIVDWRDADDTPLAGGAESSYYLTLPTPYNAKNAPLETLDELLLVKDMTPQLVYGNDSNRNGILDDSDVDPVNPDSKIAQLDHGIADLVTVYSTEANTDAAGAPRVNVNNPAQRPQLQDILTTVGARLPPPGRLFANVIDFYYGTSLPLDQFRKIADKVTTVGTPTVSGLVNLNSAPREVLICLPTLTDSDASAIISRRESGGFTDLLTLTEVLTREKAITVGGLVTIRSFRCSADIVACSASGRAFKRYRAVFDAAATPVKLIYWRDVTSLGWPLDPAILTQLRAGQALDTVVSGSSSTNQTGVK
jgi:type II secretory pathway component PulK